MKKTLPIIVLLLFIGQSLYAQNIIKGIVKNAQTKEVIPGVLVHLKDKSKGTVTDYNGAFSLEVPNENSLLYFHMVGLKDFSIPANQASEIFLENAILGLDEVIVSASRDAQKKSEIPAAVSKISSQEIEDYKPASLDQILNTQAGVYMVDLGNEQHMMSIRQPISTKSLFLYLEDGMQVRPSGNFNHNALLEMNQASIENIEVMRGAASSIYGSEAVGGVVNVLTYRPKANFEGKVGLRATSQGYYRSDVRVSDTKGKFSYAISENLSFNRNENRDHTDMDKKAITAYFGYDLSENIKLWNNFTYVDYFSQMTGSLDEESFFDRKYSSHQSFTKRDAKLFRNRTQLDLNWNNGSKSSVAFVYKHNTLGQTPSYRVKETKRGSGKYQGEINENQFQSFTLWAQDTRKFDLLDMKWTNGISLDYSPIDYYAEHIDVVYDSTLNKYTDYIRPDSLISDYKTNALNYAAYSQFEISPIEQLKITAGLRADLYTYDFNNQIANAKQSGYKAPDTKNEFFSLTPKLGLTYNVNSNIGFYGNYSRGFVPPSISELYRGQEVPDLKPAKFANYETGGWFSLFQNKLFLEASLYWLVGYDEIITVTENNQRFNRNAGRTNHQGIEYAVKYQITPSLIIRTAGSNSFHRFEEYKSSEKSDYKGNTMASAPEWTNNMGLDFKPKSIKNLYLGLEWQHVSPYYMDNENTVEYAGYDTFNFRSSYEILGIELWAQVLNITDKTYASRASVSWGRKQYTPGTERTFVLGLNYKF